MLGGIAAAGVVVVAASEHQFDNYLKLNTSYPISFITISTVGYIQFTQHDVVMCN